MDSKRINELTEIEMTDIGDTDFLLVDDSSEEISKKIKVNELIKGKENISNKITDYPLESWDVVTDEQYFGAKAVAKDIHVTAITLADHMNNVYDNQQHITADERTAWNAKADGEEFNNVKSSVEENTNARHTHSNKDVLDGISTERVEKWDAGGNNDFIIKITSWTMSDIECDATFDETFDAIRKGKKIYFKQGDDTVITPIHYTTASDVIIKFIIINTVEEFYSIYCTKANEWVFNRAYVMNMNTNAILSADNTITIEHYQEAILNDECFDKLNVVLSRDMASNPYISYLSFKTGGAECNVTVSSTIRSDSVILHGDDVNSEGVFTPQANTIYEIAFRYVNTTVDNNKHIIVGRVGAV